MRTTPRTTAGDLAMTLNRLVRNSVQATLNRALVDVTDRETARLQPTDELATDDDASDGRLGRNIASRTNGRSRP